VREKRGGRISRKSPPRSPNRIISFHLEERERKGYSPKKRKINPLPAEKGGGKGLEK